MGRCFRFYASGVAAFVVILSAQLAFASGNPAAAGSKQFCIDNNLWAAQGTPLQVNAANNIAFSQTMFSTDYATAGVGGLRNVGGGTITLAGVSGTVTKALLYWHGPTNSSDSLANASITVNGNGFVGTNIGFSDDNCWGFANSQAYVVDLTSLVSSTGNGAYVLTGLGADIASVAGGKNTNGASLIVFFDDGNGANDRDVVLFHGNDANGPNPFDADGWNVSLAGINYTAGTANLQLHVADGQYTSPVGSFIDDSIVVNSVVLVPIGETFSGTSVPSANNGPFDNGNLWDIANFDVTSFLSPGPNSLTLTTGIVGDCLGLVVAIVDLPGGSAPNDCDLVFEPEPNWPLFADYFSSNSQFMLGGIPYPIQPGDLIHATDPQGVVCGITTVLPDSDGVYLIHVLGDDPKTLEDEGAIFGDSITLWLNCDCPVVATNTWSNFGNFEYDALWDCEGCDSICGFVYDASCFIKSDCHVDSATVELWSSYPDGVILSTTMTDEFGHFCLHVDDSVEYDVRFYKKGWCTQVVEDWQCEDGTLFVGLMPLDFTPLPNWPYFTDYYSSDAMFMHDDVAYPIIPGDVIYATDPDGVICGVTSVMPDSFGAYLIHVLGDDPKTLEDEGAEPGDSIVLWLNCTCPDTATDTWLNFGSYRFDALWDCDGGPLCCELCEGWNMWSHNRILPDYARQTVLSTIDLNYSAVRSGLCDYGSISWYSNRPVNDLVNVSPWYGYDIFMLQADTVCIEGDVIDPTTPIYLCEGWNYIPYWPEETDNLPHALQSLAGNYAHVFTMYCDYGVASWNALRDPQNNDLVCMEPCKGYWIRMTAEDTLIYPDEAEGCLRQSKLVANSTSGRVKATPSVADFWADQSSLNAGDMITVRTSSGMTVGEAAVGHGGMFLVHVYGDVPYTPEVEGAISGEELTFEINGMSASVIGNSRWNDRGNDEITVTPSSGSTIPAEYALLQNYPNPFNAGTVMPFALKNASDWTLTVYNIMGQTVRTFGNFSAAGTVHVTWDGNDHNGAKVPSGVYFYRVTTPEWTATRKMTLLK